MNYKVEIFEQEDYNLTEITSKLNDCFETLGLIEELKSIKTIHQMVDFLVLARLLCLRRHPLDHGR